MKKVISFIFILLCVSCYDDDLTIIDEPENSLHNKSELTTLLRGVSSHNTTFDQFMDGSSCFSIEFPYKIKLEDNQVLRITNKDELYNFAHQNEQNYDFLYPLEIKTADYNSHQIAHKNEHLDLLIQCEEGLLFKDHINCASLVYPIELSVAYTNQNRFERKVLHDPDNFYNYLTQLSDNVRFEIIQPVDLMLYSNQFFKTSTNQELLIHLLEAANQDCNPID